MPEAVIVAAARSPIGKAYKGSLTSERADDLAVAMVRAALDKVPSLDPHEVDDVLLGTAQPAGEQGYGLARVVAVTLGLDDVPGTTVQRYCASSVQTTRMALHAVKAGEARVLISAGTEVVSRFGAGKADGMPDTRNPRYADAGKRSEQRAAAGSAPWTDPRAEGTLPDVYVAMGQTAENVAQSRSVSRTAQDEFAALSQQRAQRAIADGFFATDITPFTRADGVVVSADDGPRPGVTAEKLGSLKPAFREDGTVTAGNCCGLNDGAAALVIMSADRASELGITPLARIVSTGVSALSPEIMGLGPVEATRRALALAGMSTSDLDLVELNEAFAAQVLPVVDELKLDIDKVNVHGGAIALGHPFGQTGARLTTTLLNGLAFRGGQTGLVTMCTAGGQGMALVLERLS
ncbi:acetyl-CoA acetyltransferase [Prauserella marina]|uniref:acetyl-CoA C-acyltransferase n=1 Tax=Prauserella marina TaxID=530584 RepID=A0A222VQW3_9PSEU|nr:acetyl-CoA C-acetyltransferase [Prauserella marina]ASR36297.1 acetyl-CoA acetyltransferase [Prauserella marina]PWV77076.1 acetyl-CoA C-acetyltransferase [Prauserella marina]SDD03835.1 acetyl-CoA C-acetyltransferase [Prauserella marina]